MSAEQPKPSIEHMRAWAMAYADKGIYKMNTTKGKLSAVDQFLSVLGSDEPRDDPSFVLENLGSIANRWALKNSAKPETTAEYASRVKWMMEEYSKYLKDPGAFRPRSPNAAPGEAEPRARRKDREGSLKLATSSIAPMATHQQRHHTYPLPGVDRMIEYRFVEGPDRIGLKVEDVLRFACSLLTQAQDFDMSKAEHAAVFQISQRETARRRAEGSSIELAEAGSGSSN